jgi:fructokinase
MILCCGEALIDMIPSGDDPMIYRACPGGAALNASLALGRLGQRCGLMAGISTDPFGRFLEDTLLANQVGTGGLIHSDRPTTLAFVLLENGDATYSFHDEGSAGRQLQLADLPQLATPPKAVLMGGISLASEPCGTAWEAFASQITGTSVLMLDPNIRPALIPDPGQLRDRLGRMIGMADIVKLSEEDLHWLAQGAPDKWIAEVCQHALFMLTRGGQGATVYGPNETQVDVPAPGACVVDTVAAGDTFNAAVLTWLSEQGLLNPGALPQLTRSNLVDALRFACSAASLSVERQGANPPWRSELP